MNQRSPVREVILPKLGQTMEGGAIVEWLKKEGDPVSRGDPLFTVESDKAVLEVEATDRGYLRKILVPAGQTVPVMTVVALLTRELDADIESWSGRPEPVPVPAVATEPVATGAGAAPVSAGMAEQPAGRIIISPRARKTAQEHDVDPALVTGSGPGGRIVERDVLAWLAARPKATPVAVRAAQALSVDLSTVAGTGASGRITKADVQAAASAVGRGPWLPPEPPPSPAPIPEPAHVERPSVRRVPVTGLRRIIAERMATSHHTTARVTLVTEADATRFVEARAQLKESVTEEWGFAPGYNDLLAIIVARALREFDYMNARLVDDGEAIERLPHVNLGMAVDTERGLLVPVIHDADTKGLRAFGSEFRALVERARLGKSLPDDLTGGTFTITNLGMFDIDAFTPIINLPEAAILGAGRIQPKPVVLDGEIVVRQIWTLSLAFDHRLVDGAPAARFLQRIKQVIETPLLLLG